MIMQLINMKNMLRVLFICGTIAIPMFNAEADSSPKPPKEVKIMIASFGTIDSQAEVEGWLNDLLRPNTNNLQRPELSATETIANPELASSVAVVNWGDKRIEYWSESETARKENARRQQMLLNLKMATLSNPSQRYVTIGRDYLQAAINRLKSGRLIKIVDRGNMTIQQTEKNICGDSLDVVNGADCILSIVIGDREEETKSIPMDNVGTILTRTTYVTPYVGKLRDLNGNLLLALSGTAKIRTSSDNIVKSSQSDPSRKLIEQVCDQVADDVVSYFTKDFVFKVKVPSGFDEDDVEIFIDGQPIDDESVRVLSFEHHLKAELNGCKTIVKTIIPGDGNSSQTIKLNFKKTH